LVAPTEQPLSRQSLADLADRARAALHKPISRSTVWRMLHGDALKPWRYEYWIFPRDPHFAENAGPILDQKDLAARAPGAPPAQVRDDGLPHRPRQGVGRVVARCAATDAEPPGTPSQVVELQPDHFDPPQAEHR
jgi:hypothetical protein